MSHDSRHDSGSPAGASEAVSPGSFTTPSDTVWQFDTDSPVSATLTTDAVAGAGDVCVATEAGHVLALEDGGVRWCHDVGSSVTESLTFDGTTIFVVGEDRLFALDPKTGVERWEQSIASTVTTGPVVVNGLVFVGTDSKVVAFDAESGRERWRFDVSSSDVTAMVASEYRVFVAVDGWVWALDTDDGNAEWSFDPGQRVESLAFETGRLYVGTGTNDVFSGSNLYALGTDGCVLWRTKTAGDEAVVGLTVTNFSLYAVCELRHSHPDIAGQRLRKLSPWDGAMEWQFQPETVPLQENGVLTEPPAVVGDAVYIAANDGSVYQLSASSGEERHRFEASSAVKTPPTFDCGIIYAGSDDGTVHAFRPRR